MTVDRSVRRDVSKLGGMRVWSGVEGRIGWEFGEGCVIYSRMMNRGREGGSERIGAS
jgi:hypothetical protein